MSEGGRYSRILRTPHVPRLLAAAVVARLPIGIDSLAIVLFLRERTGSYAVAGAIAACFAVGTGAGGPVSGRLVDHFGQRRVLLPLASIHAGGLAALVGLALADVPAGLLAPVALLAGLTIPPISATLRPLFPALLRDDPVLVPTAYALDAVLVELVFIVGPLVTAAATALLAPQAAILLAVALILIGTVAFVTTPPSRGWRPHADAGRHGMLGALSAPGIRTIVVATVPMGFCLGAMEVTLPAFSEEEASRAWAGVLLATWSLGSAAGGLAYGARSHGRALASTYVRLSAVLPLTVLPLAAAPSLVVMLGLCVVAGVAIAPVLASGNQLIGDVAPPGAVTEAYTWPITSLVVGLAAGNAAAGVLVEVADWRVAFLVAAGGAALGAALAIARRASLELVPAAERAVTRAAG